MISPSARQRPKSTYPPELFNLIADILVNLGLADVPIQKKVEKAGKFGQVDRYW